MLECLGPNPSGHTSDHRIFRVDSVAEKEAQIWPELINVHASADDINAAVDAYNKRFNTLYPEPRVEHNYHVSGFEHPLVPVVHVVDGKIQIEPMYWGLIPHWSKDRDLAHKLWNNTINARSETMFDKPSYQGPAQYRRGIISVNSFFEYHHLNKAAYPFDIRPKEGETLTMAVLWDEWTDGFRFRFIVGR
jgi:putative SOS response-associated peptidase YedK